MSFRSGWGRVGMKTLNEKNVAIVGGSQGTGRETVRAAAAAGAKVLAVARREESPLQAPRANESCSIATSSPGKRPILRGSLQCSKGTRSSACRRAASGHVLTVANGEIAVLNNFMDPALFALFDAPTT